MLKKTPLKDGKSCRVTFTVPADGNARRVHLLGEFNDWNQAATPLARRKDGTFSTSLTLKAGREYRFRYLVDGERWENDSTADALAPNPYGTEDSVLRL